MDFRSISIILIGSSFGLTLRIFIQNNFKKSIGFDIQNTSIVNFLSSFFLGILVALNFMNNEILVLFYSGFLGCFSTFSSFIYQLFILFKKYINPLKDVKQEKKPLNKIFSVESLNLLLIKKPTKNDPIIEIKKLLFIVILKKVAK